MLWKTIGLFHNGGQHGGSTLARSHSIASSGDKSLMLMSTTAQFPLTNIDNIGNGQGTTNLQFWFEKKLQWYYGAIM